MYVIQRRVVVRKKSGIDGVGAATANIAILLGSAFGLWWFMFREKPKKKKKRRRKTRVKPLPLP